jgi:uncharacterized protein
MRFWDASALVPLLVAQSSTESMRQLLQEDAAGTLWWGTPVECASALARLEREAHATARDVNAAIARLEALTRAFDQVLAVEKVRATAQRLLRSHPLRAADALQLAAAIEASAGAPSALPFVCLDARLGDAARREGFVVLDGTPAA